ncbi:hypothetical protein [Bacteroides sp.]|uniref:hypothetical protein n=1 Tax=Bacteroides sp. TaxID=29523 RepID=UPI002A82D6E8|nr:hypothetical protein [Bacteroides sp.]
MDAQKIKRIEKSNRKMIYLYIDEDYCMAYEFSAYLLFRLFNEKVKLEEKRMPEAMSIFYFAKLPLQFIVEQFSGPGVMVQDDYIRIVLDDEIRCPGWRNSFDELKKQQQKDNNKLGEAILGFFRLGE